MLPDLESSREKLPPEVRRWMRRHPEDPRAKLLRQMVEQLNHAQISLCDSFHPLAVWYRAELEGVRQSEHLESGEPGLVWSVRKD